MQLPEQYSLSARSIRDEASKQQKKQYTCIYNTFRSKTFALSNTCVGCSSSRVNFSLGSCCIQLFPEYTFCSIQDTFTLQSEYCCLSFTSCSAIFHTIVLNLNSVSHRADADYVSCADIINWGECVDEFLA